jgi:hypothetical protein
MFDGTISSVPLRMREASSRSSTRRACLFAADSIASTARAATASPCSRRIDVHARIAFSGERSSCESTERKRSFASLSASAASS